MTYKPKKYKKFVAAATTATLVAQAVASVKTNEKRLRELKEEFTSLVGDKESELGRAIQGEVLDDVLWIIEKAEKAEKYKGLLDEKIMFISNGMEEEQYALQEENISLRQSLKDIHIVAAAVKHQYNHPTAHRVAHTIADMALKALEGDYEQRD